MTDKITPEMLRVAADAANVFLEMRDDEVWANLPFPGSNDITVLWNPVIFAKQDRMLEDWLLDKGYMLSNITATRFKLSWYTDRGYADRVFDCPRNEFRTRAVYAVKGDR